MRNLRIEIMDNGNGIYLAADPDGVWARSTEVDETITADWDAHGRLIGLEIAGSSARRAVSGLVRGLLAAEANDPAELKVVLRALDLKEPQSKKPLTAKAKPQRTASKNTQKGSSSRAKARPR